MRIIAITGYKGGVGKTMTALHISAYLATKGQTLLIDSDPNRSCESWAKRSQDSAPFRVTNEKAATRLIPGNDFLVLDTPARPASDELKEISAGADLTILPTIPDAFSVQAMLDMIPQLAPGSTYRCLLTVCPPKPSKEADNVRAVLANSNIPVFTCQIRRSSGFVKAAAFGCTVNQLTGAQRLGWQDYQALGKEVLEVLKNV